MSETEEQKDYRERLSIVFGEDNVWNTEELQRDFEVESFLAPFCMVIRRSDNARGLVQFVHAPRFYYNFMLLAGGLGVSEDE